MCRRRRRQVPGGQAAKRDMCGAVSPRRQDMLFTASGRAPNPVLVFLHTAYQALLPPQTYPGSSSPTFPCHKY